MTKKIGIRELKNNASKIVRAVREEQAEYVVTVHGEPVAVLRPLTEELEDQQEVDTEIAAEIAEMKQLAREIAAGWKSDKSGLEILEEDRQASYERLL
ncbi:MAG: type II toxin-antitoxin system Phd/YefM family antitoxin [Chloroflexi bacterium]|nr:type II toxin-antitoxin system Phd/YefM family antitoxin [Chloroflexota bacterium]